MYGRPLKLDTFLSKSLLELGKLGFIVTNGSRRQISVQAIACTVTGSLPDVPLHWMQSVASIRNVGNTDVFASGEYVGHPFRNQAAERDLKGQRRYINIGLASCARMQIYAVTSDANGIVERFCFPVWTTIRSDMSKHTIEAIAYSVRASSYENKYEQSEVTGKVVSTPIIQQFEA